MDLEAAVMSRPVLRRGGRIEWLRVARRELEAHRTRRGAPVPRDRGDRMIGVLERLRRTTGSTSPRLRPMNVGGRRRVTRKVGC
jgi:hypothetical protein